MAECTAAQQVWDVIVSVLNFILCAIAIPCVYKMSKNGKSGPKSFYWSGLLMGISATIAFCVNGFKQIFTCNNEQLTNIFGTLFTTFFGIEFYVLLLLLFMRADLIFQKTLFALSIITIRIIIFFIVWYQF